MTFWLVVGFVGWTLAVFVVGFFIGGKHKAKLMAEVEHASVVIADKIRDTGKKL